MKKQQQFTKKTKFSEYGFFTEEEALHFINAIPNTEEYTTCVAEEVPVRKVEEMAPEDYKKLSDACWFLNVTDQKLATDMADYLLGTLGRVMVDSKEIDNRNCLFNSVLLQFSNFNNMFYKDTTRRYTSSDFRMQAIVFAAKNYELMHPKINHLLPKSYKFYLTSMLDPDAEADLGMLVILRHLIKVSSMTVFIVMDYIHSL